MAGRTRYKDAQVQKQAREQIEYCEGAQAFRDGKPIPVGSKAFTQGFLNAEREYKNSLPY